MPNNDLISRADVLDLVQSYGPATYDKPYGSGDMIIRPENVMALPAVSGWISVKDRLPDDASDVLVYYDNGTESRIIPVNYYKGCWYDCVFNRPIDDLETGFIGYWMSLPEPPKEENDNEDAQS